MTNFVFDPKNVGSSQTLGIISGLPMPTVKRKMPLWRDPRRFWPGRVQDDRTVLQLDFASRGKIASLDIEMQAPTEGHSSNFYLFSLPKSGSVLVNRMMKDIVAKSGWVFVDLPGLLFERGILDSAVAFKSHEIFARPGYCFGGFRQLPGYIPPEIIRNAPSILVIRDPRDMIVSHYFSMAWSHGAPGETNEQMRRSFSLMQKVARGSSIDDYAIYMGFNYAEFFYAYKEHLEPSRSRLLRYEDFIYDKASLVRNLADSLKVSLSDEEIGEIVARHDVRPDREDPAQHVRQIDPGDHRRKLSRGTVEKLNVILGGLLQEFGYPM